MVNAETKLDGHTQVSRRASQDEKIQEICCFSIARSRKSPVLGRRGAHPISIFPLRGVSKVSSWRVEGRARAPSMSAQMHLRYSYPPPPTGAKDRLRYSDPYPPMAPPGARARAVYARAATDKQIDVAAAGSCTPAWAGTAGRQAEHWSGPGPGLASRCQTAARGTRHLGP